MNLAHGGPLPCEKESEFRCEECGSRCTKTDLVGEVGHKYGCPRRPDHLPTGGSGGASYWSGDRGETETVEKVLVE